MTEPVVTKEYFEDLGEQDDEGYYDFAYRYWVYSFDLDGRHYRARIYVETPDTADVLGTDGTRHPEHDEDLRVITAYLRREAGIRAVLTLGPSGAFEPFLEA